MNNGSAKKMNVVPRKNTSPHSVLARVMHIGSSVSSTMNCVNRMIGLKKRKIL